MKKIFTFLILTSIGLISYTQNSNCSMKLDKGVYYSVRGMYKTDTTFHKISEKKIIGYSMNTSFYYKNKLTWKDSCHFRSEHFKNNSQMKRFAKGTGYQCRLLEVTNDFIRFSYDGEVTGSTGVLTYYKYDGKIPKRYRKIKKMKHRPAL